MQIMDQELRELMDQLREEHRSSFQADMDDALDELKKPVITERDRVLLNALGPGGPAKVAVRAPDSWARQYAHDTVSWEPKMREACPPAAAFEAVEWLRAMSVGDVAKCREINSRKHNQEFHARQDLAIGLPGAVGTGGGLVPMGFANMVMTILQREARIRRLTTVITGSEYAKKVPNQTVKTVAAQHDEGADMSLGVTSPVYGSVTPEAVKLGALVTFSNELLADSPLATLSIVTTDVGEAIAKLEDESMLQSANFSNRIFPDLTQGTFAWNDGTINLAGLSSCYYELGAPYRSRAAWIINEAAADTLTTTTATDGRPMFVPFDPPPIAIDDVTGQMGKLLGRPCLVYPVGASGVPANQAAFGDFSGLVTYVREDLRAETSRDSHFSTDVTALRVSRRIDMIISQGVRMLRFQGP